MIRMIMNIKIKRRFRRFIFMFLIYYASDVEASDVSSVLSSPARET